MFNTIMGQLQRQLRQGEYDMFKSVPMFESDFIQVTKRGQTDVHRCAQIMTVGIANTNPFNPIPEVMLVAQPLVKISVHSPERQQLHVRLAPGRSFYLQLRAPPDKQEDLFAYWEEVIDLLRPPVEAYSSTHAVPAGDLFMSVFEEMDRRSPEAAHFQGRWDKIPHKSGDHHKEYSQGLEAAGSRPRARSHKKDQDLGGDQGTGHTP
ncbi:Protein Fam71A [Manis pentadactyla]|nr:Protein Fam71A [Manis pentadactyla]